MSTTPSSDAFDPRTDYLDDWETHDFVEDAEYHSPPGVGPKRHLGKLKAEIDDENLGGIGGLGTSLVTTDATSQCLLWDPECQGLDVQPMGRLVLAESGRYVVRTATKSRLGHWILTVSPEHFDDDRNA